MSIVKWLYSHAGPVEWLSGEVNKDNSRVFHCSVPCIGLDCNIRLVLIDKSNFFPEVKEVFSAVYSRKNSHCAKTTGFLVSLHELLHVSACSMLH